MLNCSLGHSTSCLEFVVECFFKLKVDLEIYDALTVRNVLITNLIRMHSQSHF